MKKGGFSLVELLVSIAIVASLCALLLPVISQSKRRGYMEQTVSNLHQTGLALSLYRADEGADGIYGDAYQMGLPFNLRALTRYGYRDDFTFWPPGETVPERHAIYIRYTTPAEESHVPYPWSAYAERNQDQSVALASMSYTAIGQPLRSLFGTFLGLGLRLDTSVMRRVRSGNWDDYAWWE